MDRAKQRCKEQSATVEATRSADPDPTLQGSSDTRQWRSLWRIHFYSGMFAPPFLLLMALTGLVILYTDPIQDLTEGDIRKVSVGGERVSLDEQVAAVQAAYPDGVPLDVTPPSAPDRDTRVFVDDGTASGVHVFVNPYSGEVLGESKPGGGIIGLANRLHGFLNNETVKIKLPAVAALWDDGPVMREYVVGDLVVELLGVWTLVLVATGLYLYWPRRSRWSTGTRGQRGWFRVRWKAGGRTRWRDLHGLGGVVLSGIMVVTIVSGLAWSTYWGEQFGSLAEELTPGSPVDPPPSTGRTRGELDRFGNQIPWNTGEFPIPQSYAPPADGSAPAPLRLEDVARIAEAEGMKPGYTIAFPQNSVAEDGTTIYGSFTLYNSWPRKTSEARDLFLDQFTGETLAEQKVYGMGPIAVAMDTLVSFHMGTQLGVVSRVLMTLLCLLTIWAVISALAMWLGRRRPGTLGLPRRPREVRLTRAVVVGAVALGVVFPQWAATALIVLALDRFVIRRVPPLRRAFGQVAGTA